MAPESPFVYLNVHRMLQILPKDKLFPLVTRKHAWPTFISFDDKVISFIWLESEGGRHRERAKADCVCAARRGRDRPRALTRNKRRD